MMSKSVYTFILLCVCAALGFTSCTHTERKAGNQTAQTPTASIPHVADSTRLIGVWLDQELTWQKNQRVAYEIIEKKKKIYIQVITFEGKKLNVNDNPALSATATELSKSGDKYISNDQPKIVYTFDKGGDMMMYDEKGLIAKCKRML